MRLAKYLAHGGVASRRKAEEIIAKGLVTVGGEVVTDPARDVGDGDDVRVNGAAVGAEVRPLYGDASQPYRCSQLFLALDVKNFTNPDAFAERVNEQAQRVSHSKRAPGIERVYAPGELSYATREGNAGTVTLSRQTFDSFVTAAKSAGVNVETLL